MPPEAASADPTAQHPSTSTRLLVLHGSHCCERVLWAIETLRLPAVVDVCAPGVHVAVLRRCAPGLPTTQLPLLFHRGSATQGSAAILDLLGCESLEPEAEQVLDDCIAPGVRQAYYAALYGRQELAADWVDAAFANAFPWLRRLTSWLPRATVGLLLRRDGARPRDLPRLLSQLSHAVSTLDGVARTELSRINANPDQPLSRLAITCGALLSPVMLPAPAPWQRPPWPDHLSQQVALLQARPLLQLAHRAWALRQQTAPGRYPGPGGTA
jgi:hypothetical protein